MKRIILFVILVASISVKAQKGIVYNPLFPALKDDVTIYTDSLLQSPISLPIYKLVRVKLVDWHNGVWTAKYDDWDTRNEKIAFIKENNFVKEPNYRGVLEGYNPKAKTEHKKYLLSLINKYGKHWGNAVFDGVPKIGMTREMFLLCEKWPDKINKTQTAKTLSEQWVYDYGQFGTKYYYFTNGKLTAIQD